MTTIKENTPNGLHQSGHHHHHHRAKKDTFDNDQDTAGMYDDGWVYSQPGKYQKGPITVGKTPPGGGEQVVTTIRENTPNGLQQIRRSQRDSFDADPTTASMYDDGDKVKTYNQKGLGSLNWKFAGGPKAEYDAAKAAKTEKKEATETLAQHHHHHKHHRNTKDSFDADGATASMYDDQHVYSEPGQNWSLTPKEKKAKAAADALMAPAPVEGLVQHIKRDSFDADPTTASMFDDGDKIKTYNQKVAGSMNWKFAGGPKAEFDAARAKAKKPEATETLSQHHHHRSNKGRAAHHSHHRHHRNQAGADTFDNDKDTVSMYDDRHVYSNAGAFKASAGGAAKAAPVEGLVQHRLRTRDSYDFDPTTTSMYDDGDKIKTYNQNGLGSLNWKFAGGPKAEYDAAKAARKKPEPTETLTQFARSNRDSFDADPTTASMYDDGDKVKTYNQKGLGSLNWKFAGGPKAEYDAAKAANKKPEPTETLIQRNVKDSFDGDSGSSSMYDDGHVYSEAGQFRPAPVSENKGKKVEELSQVSKKSHDTFDMDDKNNVGSADP